VQATGRHAQNEAFIQGGVNPSYAVREVADGHMLHARHAHELVVQAIQWERDRVTDEMHALRDQNELLRKALKLTPVLHDVDHQAKGRGNKYHRSRLSPALIRKLKPYATLKPSQRTQRLKMIRVACVIVVTINVFTIFFAIIVDLRRTLGGVQQQTSAVGAAAAGAAAASAAAARAQRQQVFPGQEPGQKRKMLL
jgi:hypothetical protein